MASTKKLEHGVAQPSEPPLQQYEPKTVHDIEEMMCNLTKAISSLSFSSKPRLHLFDLPQEIQDMIFDMAYPHNADFKPITKQQWEGREWDRRRDKGRSYVRLPFPSPKVPNLLISKRFFLSAAKSFVGNQAIRDVSIRRVLGSGHCRVITQFATRVTVRLIDMLCFARTNSMPPNMKYVTVQLTNWDLSDTITPKIIWEDELDEGDLKAVSKHYRLEDISGLKDFRITADPDPYSRRTDEEKALFSFNVRKLEGYLRPIVMRGKTHRQVLSLRDAAALYPGSLVSCTSHEIIEELSSEEKTKSKIPRTDLQLRDLPSNIEELKALMEREGEAVVDLIVDLKWRERLASSMY